MKAGFGAGYEKTTVMTSNMSPPVASAAALLRLNPRDKTIEACRICVGSCVPYPHRAVKAEDYLTHKPFEEGILTEAAEMAVTGLRPISDNYGSAEYRALVVTVMVRRALEQAGRMALASLSR